MKTKKVLAVLLSCACVVSVLAGCGNETQTQQPSDEVESSTSEVAEGNSEGSEEVAPSEEEVFDPKSITEGVTLTVAMVGNATIEDPNTNYVTQYIEETLGVNLEYMVIPSSDYGTKLNVMVAGGEALPDIVLYPYTNFLSWAEEGAILPLNDYYNDPNMSANITKFCEETGIDLPGGLANSEGIIWQLPLTGTDAANRENGTAGQRIWIYQPWLEAIGKDVPETTEEFYEMCKMVAETDLNGNGKKDEIALTGAYMGMDENLNDGWFDLLMNAFIHCSGTGRAYAENGQVGLAYASDEWKEGLKFIKKFVDDGIIPIETLTNTAEQYRASLNVEDQIVFAFSDDGVTEITNYERASQYVPVTALEGPTGLKQSHYRPTAVKYNSASGAVISSSCENPDAAFLVLDLFCSEYVSLTNQYGREGVDWDYWENAKVENKSDYGPTAEGYEISIYRYPDSTYTSEIQNTGMRYYVPRLITGEIAGGIAKLKVEPTTDEEKWTSAIFERDLQAADSARENKAEEVISYFPTTVKEDEEIADILTTINAYVPEATAAFLTGMKDIDEEWDDYLNELEKIGIDKLLETYQTAYDRLN